MGRGKRGRVLGERKSLSPTLSQREREINTLGKMDFPGSGSALVLNYETDLPIEDKVALRKEVDEIWEVFQRDVEASLLKAALFARPM